MSGAVSGNINLSIIEQLKQRRLAQRVNMEDLEQRKEEIVQQAQREYSRE